MGTDSNASLELASLLRSQADEITVTWAEQARGLPNARYKQIPPEEVVGWLEEALNQIIEFLQNGPSSVFDAYLERLTLSRHEAGFRISDVIQALLLAKETIGPHIWRVNQIGPKIRQAWVSELDLSLRFMIARLSELYADAMTESFSQETRKRLIETESLQRTTSALLERLTLAEILEIVCAEACRLTGATGSAVLLLEQESWLRVKVSIGHPLPVLERLAVTDSIAGWVVRQGKPWSAEELKNEVQAYRRNPDLESLLVIPLQGKGETVGVLDLVNKPGGFSEVDTRIMTLFATQAAVAIETARLHQQAERLAVMEERQRIARDLHDSVTQSLYTVSLYTDAARMALAAGKQAVVGEHLQEVRNMVHEAVLDMRLLIFELHPPILEQAGLDAALQARLEAVETRSGIKTRLEVDGARRLPIGLETEIYRIAQEALTNVVKHAKAQDVSVRLNYTDRTLDLEIKDNGLGFDPDGIRQSGGVGLRGIHERVQQLGGTLSIDSVPDKGTAIRVNLSI